jgi:hypothetical protein
VKKIVAFDALPLRGKPRCELACLDLLKFEETHDRQINDKYHS